VGFFNAWSYWISSWAGNAGIAGGCLGMAIALFSYIGVEVASVAAGKVRDPDRNVPKSTVFGTLAAAVVCMLALTAVFGIAPSSQLEKSDAPFSTAVNTMFGGTWVGYVMAVVVIISGFGALNGWTMICAEMPLAAAKDGISPDRFKGLSRNGVPVFGIITATVLASVAMAVNYVGSGGAEVFTTLILMTGITVAIPYGFSALAQIKWRVVDRRAMHTPRFARDMIVAVLALVFSVLFIWYSRNTGHGFWEYWAPFFLAGGALLLGIPSTRRSVRR
jgi:basic amino acid/polyamine antiporter, APA family